MPCALFWHNGNTCIYTWLSNLLKTIGVANQISKFPERSMKRSQGNETDFAYGDFTKGQEDPLIADFRYFKIDDRSRDYLTSLIQAFSSFPQVKGRSNNLALSKIGQM